MGGTNGGDPTAADRICAAATRVFAAHGAAAAATELIAAEAGVTPAAVEHHFPTRADLREAVNERVLRVATHAFSGFEAAGDSEDLFGELAERVTSIMRDHSDELHYVARATVDGDPGGLGIFDGFVALATTALEALAQDGRLDPDLDLEWAALHVVMFNLSTLLFQTAIENHLPEPLRSAEGIERWHEADTELFRRGFLRQDRLRH